MIKLFACDLDGTLLNKYHEVDEIICQAIEMIDRKGRYFTVATGRHIFAKQKLNYDIRSNYYIISMNGAMILDKDSNIITYHCLDLDFIKDVLANFSDYHFDFVSPNYKYIKQSKEDYYVTLKNGIFANKKNFDYENIAKWCIFNASDEDILNADIIKLDIMINDENDRRKFDNFLKKYDGIICNAPSVSNAYEITSYDVNKAMAIMDLCQILDIKEDEVAVYGDGINDLCMFKKFKHAYAPANAIDEVKKHALKVLGDYFEHAVSLHIMETLEK